MNYVYVLNNKGEPIMPTTRYGHVKRLLKSGMAVAVNNKPFTIRLKYDTPDIVQSLTLGIDTGRDNIGLAVSNNNGDCMFLANVVTNNKQIAKNITERKSQRMARRRHRRIRKQRRAARSNTTMQNGKDDVLRSKRQCRSKKVSYPGMEETIKHKVIQGKEAKFNNRKRPEGWLTPSARNLVQVHIHLAELICSFLPVDSIVVERVCFDFQKLENQNIRAWEYSKGPLYGFKDYKEYINKEQKGKCLLCGAPITQYHHIKYRSNGGSNSVKNIAGLCDCCHKEVHNDPTREEELLNIKKGQSKSGRIAVLNSCMHVIIDQLSEMLPTTVTDGYETKELRDGLHLPKDHCIDAYVASLYRKDVPVAADFPEKYTIRHFKKKSGNNINTLGDRRYYYNGELVAVNRHKSANQKTGSLEEYMSKYSETHTKKETDKRFHELEISPAKRVYTYHKKGIVPQFKCGDKVKYYKRNKINKKVKQFVFVVDGLNINERKLCYSNTKNCKTKFCRTLESRSLQFI